MTEAKAFVPCHLTGIFQILDESGSALHAGSKGAGVSLTHGLETLVTAKKALKNSLLISINGRTSNSATVSKHLVNIFLSRFEELRDSEIVIKHTVDVPIGAGFGTSGAAVLGLALALNEAFDLGLSSIEAAQLAHVAEIECKTGLGTVIAEYFGGIEIRVKPGAPGIGELRNIPVPKDTVVACLAFGSLSTQKLLTDTQTRQKIREIGGDLVNTLVRYGNVTNFMALSRQFAEHLGLITRKIRITLDATDKTNLICSMPMFGESVFTLIERKDLKPILQVFKKCKSKGQIIVSGVDQRGARLL